MARHCSTLAPKEEFELLPGIPKFFTMLAEDLKKLSKSEKILLINDLWDDIADTEDDLPLSQNTKELLDRRYKAFQANPNEGLPWDEVKKKIRSEL